MADIGIMGGTFDPIHNGHLMLGKQAYLEYGLAEVWFMPSGNPPHKTDRPVTKVADRCEMVRLAVADCPCFRFSDFEAAREGKTYTAETLRLLHQRYPQHRFFFIIGADSLYQIESWYHPEQVLAQAVVLAAGRDYPEARCTIDEQIAYLNDRYQADVRRLHCEEVDISSEQIRRRKEAGKSISRYVPGCVENYIRSHSLYQSPSPVEKRNGRMWQPKAAVPAQITADTKERMQHE